MIVHQFTGHRGFVIEVNAVPSGFLASLERRGLAAMTVVTAEGVYCEPRESLATVIGAFEAVGLNVQGVTPAGASGGWRTSARPASSARQRLTSICSATWLPTLPAA